METSTFAAPVVRAVKKVMQPKLSGEDAISRLRQISQRRDEIERKYKSVLDECKKIEAEVATAQQEFDANPTPDGVHKLITVRLRSREATEIFAALDQRLRHGLANREFLAEFKTELRGVLLAAVKHRLKRRRKHLTL